MKKSVHRKVRESLESYPDVERHKWVLMWPGQCVGLLFCGAIFIFCFHLFYVQVQSISLTYWTSEITDCLLSNAPNNNLKNYLLKCVDQISTIVALVRGRLSTQNRITLGALVVLDVHARDTLAELIEFNVEKSNDFKWLSQVCRIYISAIP